MMIPPVLLRITQGFGQTRGRIVRRHRYGWPLWHHETQNRRYFLNQKPASAFLLQRAFSLHKAMPEQASAWNHFWSDSLEVCRVFVNLWFAKPMVHMRVAFHENDGNHENDEDNPDSYKRGAECWTSGNHGNRGSHEKPCDSRVQSCKPRVPQTTGLEIPEFGGGGPTLAEESYLALIFDIPGPRKTGMRAHSPQVPFYKTALNCFLSTNFREHFCVSRENDPLVWWIPKLRIWCPQLRLGSQHRVPKPPFLLGFLGIHHWFSAFLLRDKFCLRRLPQKFISARAPYTKTQPSFYLICTQCGQLSGPLRLRVQSRSRTRLRIAASIAFLFALVAKGFSTLQRHYRAVEPFKQFRTRQLRAPACAWMRIAEGVL